MKMKNIQRAHVLLIIMELAYSMEKVWLKTFYFEINKCSLFCRLLIQIRDEMPVTGTVCLSVSVFVLGVYHYQLA